MSIPGDLRYTAAHEWLRQDGEVAVIGITEHAQGELGDVVYLELPEVGGEIVQGESFGVIESVKAASDLYAPISGEVTAVNGALEAAPQLVNESPYDGGQRPVCPDQRRGDGSERRTGSGAATGQRVALRRRLAAQGSPEPVRR
jgi:glycine cleavage system H protein